MESQRVVGAAPPPHDERPAGTAGGVLASMLVLGLTLGGSFALLAWGQIWFPPSATVCGLLLGWPLWRWRRVEATLTYLGDQLDQLDREPHVLPETETGRPIAGYVRVEVDEFADPLEARIEIVQRALRRTRAMRRRASMAGSSRK